MDVRMYSTLSLNIKPKSRGMVVGSVTYDYKGVITNCELSNEVNISSFADQIQNIRSETSFILVVKKKLWKIVGRQVPRRLSMYHNHGQKTTLYAY